jgi:C1A family cysteine protease
MSEEEFRSNFLGFQSSEDIITARSKWGKNGDNEKIMAADYESVTSRDWTGIYTTPVKDQGYCGSCWAFSTAEQLESDGIRSNILTTSDYLSPQQIVSW